jgi:ABC-2 type transport system permease protein|tara:strand:+ start:2317 stop:3726 length:1410 start_codon:yes stop_codon:yes gene_type:complete
MINILVNELKGFLRNKLFIFLSLFFLIALCVVTFFGIIQNKKQVEAQKIAKEHIRLQWDEMEPSNPHSAAHFGTYAFKSTSILNSIDEGINSVTGNVLRLEGHKQNDVAFSEASQSLLISKFGKLKPALIFQFIIPLFLIFFSFNSYTSERSNGRLKLLLIQGVSLKQIVFAKAFSIWIIGVVLLLASVLVQLLFNSTQLSADTLLRLTLLLSVYAVYFFIIVNLTVLLSVVFKNSTSALSLTILIWVIWTIFLPSTIGKTAEEIFPLPTRIDLKESMAEDRSKGINGHNPREDRRQALEKATLEKYKVEKLQDLPINFSGILMQEDEEYGNKVWDKHFGSLYNQLKAQKYIYQIFGVVNPFISLQNLSMGMSGTDMHHHLSFLNQAEKYRRVFIKSLNDEYAFGGSKTGERGWKASNEFFRSVKEFQYQNPTFRSFYSKYAIDFFILLFWFFILLILLSFSSRKTLDI